MTALKKTSADDKQPETPRWHQTDEQVKLWAVIWQCFKTKQSFIFLTYVDIMIPTLKCHKKKTTAVLYLNCFMYELWNHETRFLSRFVIVISESFYFSLEKKNQNKQTV